METITLPFYILKNSNNFSFLDWINANLAWLTFTLGAIFSTFLKEVSKLFYQWSFRNINFPIDIFYNFFDRFRTPMFTGLESVSQYSNNSILEIEMILYEIYVAIKSFGFIDNYHKPILYEEAYNNKTAESKIFFEKCRLGVVKAIKSLPEFIDEELQLAKYNLLVENYMPVCKKFISSSEARLFVFLVGATFGGIFDEDDYISLVCRASEMTIENKYLRFNKIQKNELFLRTVKQLIPIETVQDLISPTESFQEIFVSELKETFLKLSKSGEEIDKNLIVCNKLIETINN